MMQCGNKNVRYLYVGLCALIFLGVVLVHNAFGETIGFTSVHSQATSTDNRQAMPFVMSEDGTIESISMYHGAGSSSSDVVFAVYADNGDVPGSRLGVTDSVPISASAGWQTIDLKTPVNVTNGQKIWLAWLYETQPEIYWQAGTATTGRARASQFWANGMPTNYGSSTTGTAMYSIYANYSTGSTVKLVNADFTSGAQGFAYQDDSFRGTNQPSFANGTHTATNGNGGTGGLEVVLGGASGAGNELSGGWRFTFNLTQPGDVQLSLWYSLTMSSEYESNEYGQALLSVDGILYGNGANNSLAQLTGNGNGGSEEVTGWQHFAATINALSAGNHTIIVGGFNNQATHSSEITTVRFDDIVLSIEGGDPGRTADSLALVALYNSTDGPNWTNNTNWLSGNSIDTWYGISIRDNRVNHISLYNNKLSGSISPDIGNLSQLEYLELPNNNLSGTIPPELGSLSQLIVLSLYTNNLTGALPTEIFNLAELTTLSLSENSLSGQIPIQIEGLIKLITLNLSNNNFTGPIPIEFVNLSAIEYVRLADNSFSGQIPANIGVLGNLYMLDLTNNQLSGSIPSSIGDLSSLRYLELGYNNLSGSIPPELGNLSAVERLLIHQNDLTGSIPATLGNLSNLTYLTLATNNLSGAVPVNFQNMNSLEGLMLYSNNLSGTLPQELGNLSNLKDMRLFINQFDGVIPSSFGNLSNLTDLYIYDNNFTDIEPGVESLNLTTCDLGNNKFCNLTPAVEAWANTQDPDWASTQDCANPDRVADSLALVALYNNTNGPNWTNNTNWLSGNTIDTWFGVTLSNDRVTRISLGLNGLNGPLPSEIGNLSELDRLILANNDLSGIIPTEIGNLTKLTSLSLADNALQDAIPSSAGALVNLQYLYFDHNDLSGSIPIEMQNLINLKFFYLQSNQFNGSLSSWFGNLVSLEQLKMSDNNFEGTIPPEFGNLINIYDLQLDYNNFQGSIPSSMGNLINLSQFHIDNNSFTDMELGIESISPSNCRLGNNKFCNLTPAVVTWANTVDPDWASTQDCADPGRVADSLALVAFYNSTNGPNWTNNTNWLTGNSIDLWYGVTVNSTSNRVDSLVLSNNGLSGTIPAEIGDLIELVRLNLYNNDINGSIPSSLSSLVKLERLELASNNLAGEIFSYIQNLTKLITLNVGYNQLNGTIPIWIGTFSNLEWFGLERNNFSGSIPDELSNLSNLRQISLHLNQLEGSLPPSLGNIVTMEYVLLGNNNFSGTIPGEFGNWSNIQTFEINNNQFTRIEEEIASITPGNCRLGNNKFCNLTPAVVTWANTVDPDWASTQDCSDPLTISTHPQSQTRAVGESVTYSVIAMDGTTPYVYQWQVNTGSSWEDINGATSSSYTINPIQSGDAADYRCIVTDNNGSGNSVTSDPATLTLTTTELVNADFNSDAQGFSYQDDAFRGTNQPSYANGTRTATNGNDGTGGLEVTLGATSSAINNISGGWSYTFNLTQPGDVELSLRYSLTLSKMYESDEYGQALLSVDGILYGNDANNSLAQISGNGNGGSDDTTGWQQFTTTINSLNAGNHTIILGGYNNRATYSDEITTIRFDDVLLTTNSSGNTAPVVTNQPQNDTITEGDDVSFTVAATGDPTPTYQWYKNGSLMSGRTNAILDLDNVPLSDNGAQYHVEASNSEGSVSSDTVTLTVNEQLVAPVITEQPLPQSTTENGSASFSVMATGNPTPIYQWYKNGSIMDGHTNATLDLDNVPLSDNGAEYHAEASNSEGSVSSDTVTLTVNEQLVAPVITVHPLPQSTTENGNASFNVVATGNPTPTYQWYKNGSMMSGQTNATLDLDNVPLSDNGAEYHAEASNSEGSVSSDTVVLTVTNLLTAPAITDQPLPQTTVENGSASFMVGVSGNPTPTIQWYKNGTILSEQTNTILNLDNVPLLDNGAQFFAVATNSEGSAPSDTVTLTVTPATAVHISSHPLSLTATIGHNVTFSVGVSGGTTPYVYQWQINTGPSWENISSTNTSDYMISSVQNSDAAEYRCVVTDDNGSGNSVTSNAATLTVTTAMTYVYPQDCGVNEHMHVDGKIKCSALEIGTWALQTPDYVFDKSYNLKTLKQLQEYLDTHSHLPEIPSAKEMKEKGVNLSELNMQLLKKIEELHLYYIQQHMKIEANQELLDQVKKLNKKKHNSTTLKER